MANPPLEARLKDVLDETRLAMLGSQLLLGLQYRAAFAQTFGALPAGFTALDALALLLILGTTALLLGTPALHRIAVGGHASVWMLHRASLHLKLALVPFALALGFDIAIGLARPLGTIPAALGGGLFVLGAAAAWYGWPLLLARRSLEEDMEDKQQPLEARIEQALTELRVVLPGAQALFGFQFTAVLTEAFGQLPPSSKDVHLASMGAVAVSVILLIAPAAYHRLAAHGNSEQRVLDYTGKVMLWALGFLALGMTGDAYVTVRKIAGDETLALAATAAVAIGFLLTLYGLPLLARSRSRLMPAGAGSGDRG